MPARTATFTGLAYLVSWALFYPAGPLFPADWVPAIFVLFMAGPIVAAFATAALFDRGKIIRMLALTARPSWWWLVAWLLPPILAAVAALVTSLFPGVHWVTVAEGTIAIAAEQGVELTPEDLAALPPFWTMLLVGFSLGGAINTIAAIGEEAGWRGYLWSVLRPLGFWPASLSVGLIWGFWHAPLIAIGHNYGTGYAGYPWLGILTMILFTVGISPILGLLRDHTNSAWPAALFHGTMNAVAGLFLIIQTGASSLIAGLPGLAGIITLAVSAAIIAYLRRGET